MLPHNHFLIACLAIAMAGIVFFPDKSFIEIGEWILIGGFLSVLIDLDAYALTVLKSRKEYRLKPFRNPLEVFRKYESFMETIAETGVLKTLLITHLSSSILIISIFFFYLNSYLTPALLGVVSHLISDIPNLRRLNTG